MPVKPHSTLSRTVGNIKPAPYNPRKASDKTLTALEQSMFEFGDLSCIVVNVRTGHQITGHQRLKKMDPAWPITTTPFSDRTGTVAWGRIQTPRGHFSYREVNWPEAKEKAANIAVNKIQGSFDFGPLREQLIDLENSEFDLTMTGFVEEDIKDMLDWGPKKDKSKKLHTCPACGFAW
jgi:hypothetical protein